jgi:hypothetical protein
MASLIPCAACSRHIRHHERQCPFCGAERTPTARPRREGVMSREATRATLIALGLTVAGPACGGREAESDRSNGPYIVPYGLPPTPEAGAGGGGAGGDSGDSGDSGDGGASGSGGEGGDGAIIPPYGAMPEPDGGSGGAADTPDSGTPPDAGSGDAGTSETPDAAR